MNAYRSSRSTILLLFGAIILLLSACQPATLATNPQPTQPPPQLTATPVILDTQTPAQPTQTPSGTADITLDYSGVAQNVTIETLATQPASDDEPYLEITLQYRRLTLQGYPVANDRFKPQIFIFPAGDLAAANESAGKVAADLQALLKNQQAGDQLPFLPLVFSARQAMDAQVTYLDFKGGKAVRFLTQFNNGMSPINNYQLIYTFQGLTSDGKYYISAVLPLNNSELPVDSTTNWEPKMGKDYQNYVSSTVILLNQQPPASFTPDLNKLDALMRSIEVK